jgi:LysM repeat protein
MLEQYHKDISSNSHDVLSESQFQMSQRKLVFTLVTGALALLLFLFLVGGFKNEEVVENLDVSTGNKMLLAKLQELETRLEKLEQQGTSLIASATEIKPSLPATAFDPELFEEPSISQNQSIPLSSEALEQLVVTSPIQSEPLLQIPAAEQKRDLAPAIKAEEPRSYIVQPGDSLSKISLKFYGTTKNWREIYAANRERISNMNQLKVGTRLVIPEEVK